MTFFPSVCLFSDFEIYYFQINKYHTLLLYYNYFFMSDDYKQRYEQKCQQFEELDAQYTIFQQQSNEIITELENQVKQLKKKNQNLAKELQETKDKRKTNLSTLEKELELIKKQKNDFQKKFIEFQKKVVDLQNTNQSLESENRASKCMLSQYQHRVERTMQQLALLQTQLEQNKTTSKEQITRLKNQLKQTEQQLYVVHLKHQKHNDESEHRRSRLSSMSNSSYDDAARLQNKKQTQIQVMQEIPTGINNDFKRKQNISFHKTLNMVTNLIGELDTKMNKIRTQRKTLIIN